MKILLIAFAVVVTIFCQSAYAYLPAPTSPYTITFDEILPGNDLSYYESQYGLVEYGWYVIDHISGANVLMWNGNPLWAAHFAFGRDPIDYPDTQYLPYNIRSVGAFFSTEPGVVIRMTGYNSGGIPVASALIGILGESWTNRYVSISSEVGDIRFVHFDGVNSQNDRYHFSIDEMTIVPVPEPSSLAALGLGLVPVVWRLREEAGLSQRRKNSMKRAYYVVAIALLAIALLPGIAAGWDLFYDGSVMPNDPLLGANSWNIYGGSDLSGCSTDGDNLHIIDQLTDAVAYFYRFTVPQNSPIITLETRVRVLSGDGTALVAGTSNFATSLLLYSDRIDIYLAPGSPISYQVDLTQFRTIRIAINYQSQSYVWLDGDLLTQGVTTFPTHVYPPGDVQFGSMSPPGVNESYWDYIAYSKEFLPVPELSSLATLGLGLVPVVWRLRRKRG